MAALRGGRTNTSASDLGGRARRARALAGLLRAARRGALEPVERPVLRIAFANGPGREVRYGMFFGAGVVHRGIQLVKSRLPHRQQGVLGASLVTGGLLARLALLGDHGRSAGDPTRWSIRVDGFDRRPRRRRGW